MTSHPLLPRSPPERLAYLRSAARHGDAIMRLIETAAPAGALLDYAAATPELAAKRAPDCVVVTLGPYVEWRVALDERGKAAGHSFSGYGDLMDALGIDFSGAPLLGPSIG